MAFQVSPGVLVQERDLTRIIPAVSTAIGAFAGSFNKFHFNPTLVQENGCNHGDSNLDDSTLLFLR